MVVRVVDACRLDDESDSERLSLTKAVSSCPIPDNSFQHFAIVLDRGIDGSAGESSRR